MDSAIVTLREGTFEADVELPLFVPLRELYPQLLKLLRLRDDNLRAVEGIVLERRHAGMLQMNVCLKDYGVCSGDILTVADIRAYKNIL